MATARRWSTARRSHAPALAVTLVLAVIGPLFVASYGIAMGDPTPHDVPIAVVGSVADLALVGRALDAAAPHTFRIERLDAPARGRTRLDQQKVYALVEPNAQPPTLVVSTASAPSISRLVTQESRTLEEALGTPLRVVDAHPTSPRDPDGLVLFYLALGATILGFVGAIQTRVNAPGTTLAYELGWDVARSVVVALAIAVVIGPILRLDRYPVGFVWPVLATTMFIAAAVFSFWRAAIGGRWALLPTWILFVVVANPSSGGATAPQLLPPLYEFVGRWLPTGATVSALRDITYFPDHVHAEPLVVLGAWAVLSAGAFVTVRMRRFGTGPEDHPQTAKSAGSAEQPSAPV